MLAGPLCKKCPSSHANLRCYWEKEGNHHANATLHADSMPHVRYVQRASCIMHGGEAHLKRMNERSTCVPYTDECTVLASSRFCKMRRSKLRREPSNQSGVGTCRRRSRYTPRAALVRAAC